MLKLILNFNESLSKINKILEQQRSLAALQRSVVVLHRSLAALQRGFVALQRSPAALQGSFAEQQRGSDKVFKSILTPCITMFINTLAYRKGK